MHFFLNYLPGLIGLGVRSYTEMIDEKQQKVLQLTKELDDQGVKLERVQKQNSRYARDIRKNSKEELPEEVGAFPKHTCTRLVAVTCTCGVFAARHERA